MKRTISINPTKPQYITVTNLSYAQIDYWFGHARMDLKKIKRKPLMLV